jgi:Type II secretion system (T2SS), protein M subtype b
MEGAPVKDFLQLLLARFGGVALAALGLIAAGILFLGLVIRPQESRMALLESRLGHGARQTAADSTRSGTPSAKLAAFYAFFERQEGQVDWLAKLYGSARAAGLELRTADYRLIETSGRIARYEVTLPLAGSYAQLRDFLDHALEENPVLSLDQLTIRRKRVNDAMLEAEAVITIHLLKP